MIPDEAALNTPISSTATVQVAVQVFVKLIVSFVTFVVTRVTVAAARSKPFVVVSATSAV